MSIENLIKAVPPPAAPFEAFRGPWEVIEADLETSLPQDYKDFARLYGSGYFMEFLGIHIPNTQNPNTRLEWQAQVVRDGFRTLTEEYCPYPMWPDPGGLLPFGGTDDGDEFFWRMRGLPDDWRVVIWDRGFGSFEELDCDLTDFLAGLATGEILPKDWPDDLVLCARVFQPNWPVAPADPPRGVTLSWRMTPPKWDISSATQDGNGNAPDSVVVAGRIAPAEPPK